MAHERLEGPFWSPLALAAAFTEPLPPAPYLRFIDNLLVTNYSKSSLVSLAITPNGSLAATINPYLKTKSDDTRERIMTTAEALFRRLGYTKTAVADIAAELRMSPANIYRFFNSKNAIVEAICRRCLSEVEEKAWAVARSKASAAGGRAHGTAGSSGDPGVS